MKLVESNANETLRELSEVCSVLAEDKQHRRFDAGARSAEASQVYPSVLQSCSSGRIPYFAYTYAESSNEYTHCMAHGINAHIPILH